jgi:glycerate dehydrogenase
MLSQMNATFLDFASLGSGVNTAPLDKLLKVSYHSHSSNDDLLQRLHGNQIAILNKLVLDKRTIQASTDLKLIVLAATGTDNIDLEAAKEAGIAVSNIRGYCTASVVQHVMSLVLGLTRHIRGCPTPSSGKDWNNIEMRALAEYPVRELTGKALGIVGYGNLGYAVAQVGKCFGMEILVADRIDINTGKLREGRTLFSRVLKEADIISLHCPLTPTTRHLIGTEELKMMKSDALLINTARGALVDSQALVDALDAGAIGGAGIDVLSKEPPEDDEPLLRPNIQNLIITPHIAWLSKESSQRALNQMAENIADYLAGGRLRRVV